MSDINTLIENLKTRATQIEQAIAQSLANHNALLGQANEAKHMLDMATKLADTVAPMSPVTEVINVIDGVIDTSVGTSQES